MPVDQLTANQNYQKPYGTNDLAHDVARIRAALDAIDADVADLLSQVVAKAAIDSPVLEGAPEAPTADAGDNSEQIANTAFVAGEIAANALTPSGVQNVANKNLLTNNRIVDVADQTKKLATDISSFTTSTTRTHTYPDDNMNFGSLPAKYAFRRGNILGTVSQTGGTPTGALIETGSNSNGRYARFADGTQICWGALQLDMAIVSRCSGTWTFPAAFVDAAYRVSSEYKPNNGADAVTTVFSDAAPTAREILAPAHGGKTTTTVAIAGNTITGATDFDAGDHLYVDVIAIGRWF